MDSTKIEEGEFGPRLVLAEPWAAVIADLATRNHVQELYLNYALGWHGRDLDFLSQLSELKGLHVLAPELEDISGILALTNLKSLKLEVASRATLDLAALPSLQLFSGFWSNVSSSLFSCSNLEWLRLIGYSQPDSKGFSKLRALRGVALYSARLRELGELAVLPLSYLSMAHCRRLVLSSEPLLNQILREVNLVDCRSISRLDAFAGSKELRVLIAEDCGDIDSIQCLASLRQLEVLRIGGNTDVTDGNLTVLRDFPKLRNLAFTQRKHYNLSWKALPPELFESRYHSSWA